MDITIIEIVLNTEFNYLSDWLTGNGLLLNLKKDKIKIMVSGTKLQLPKVNSNIILEYDSIKVVHNHTNTWASKSIPR